MTYTTSPQPSESKRNPEQDVDQPPTTGSAKHEHREEDYSLPPKKRMSKAANMFTGLLVFTSTAMLLGVGWIYIDGKKRRKLQVSYLL